MARFKLINGEQIPFTPEEEAERDAEELAWASRHIPTLDEIDTEELNKILLAEGSVTRAILETLFGMMKGTIPINPDITKQQFITAFKAKMRS